MKNSYGVEIQFRIRRRESALLAESNTVFVSAFDDRERMELDTLLAKLFPAGLEAFLNGNADAYKFATPQIPGYDYSFSGIKTSFLYFLRDRLKENPDFIEKHKADLCASIQKTIVGFLLKKAERAAIDHHVRQMAIAGGVSANSLLRSELERICQKHHWQAFIPPFKFCTDNAAMVGIAGYFKYLKGEFADISLPPYTRG